MVGGAHPDDRATRGGLLRAVLRAYSDGEWHTCAEAFELSAGAITRKGSVSATIATAAKNHGHVFWEQRTVDHPTRDEGVFQYRITGEGRAKLAALETKLGGD